MEVLTNNSDTFLPTTNSIVDDANSVANSVEEADDHIEEPSENTQMFESGTSGAGFVDCPEIQITCAQTVDQTASDYEPEEAVPAPTPTAGVSSPGEEPSTPTGTPLCPQDIIASALSEIQLNYSGGKKPVNATAPEVGSDAEFSSIGDSFVMVNNSDVTVSHASPATVDCGLSPVTSIRPSIELDESSTEHEYQVSLSNKTKVS